MGAGLVARPYVQYLSDKGHHVVVASRTLKKAERLIEGCDNTEAVTFDIEKDDELLRRLTREADLVCSLLPYTYHVKAARAAVDEGKHFCTTSYISDQMKQLDTDAKKAGILLLNECGVDPGIDHMSAKKIIDNVHAQGGEIVSFTSFTGGLPAPEANTNPLGYKLSWSPRGVLLAGRNDAHFLRDGKEVRIPGKELFANCETIEVPGMGEFEGYPNRDSIAYIAIYDIPETRTMLRGTLRYKGWCSLMKSIADLGLLDLQTRNLSGYTYKDIMLELAGRRNRDAKAAVSEALGLSLEDSVIEKLEWLGLFENTPVPEGIDTYLDVLCHLFEQKLQYGPQERDMIVMHHEFLAKYDDRVEMITSTLVDYGIPGGDTSMSRTVALPVAIASRLILEGKISLAGVHRPTMPELYEPILQELESLGIKFCERKNTVTS